MRAYPALFVILAVSCAGAAREAPVPTPRITPVECQVNGVDGPARCATLNVAEGGTPARQIALRLIILPSRSAAPQSDPIVPLAGGPGQGTASLAAIYGRRFDAFRDERDIVLVDQRGTGESNGLHCPAPPAAAALFGKLFDPLRLAACRDELSTRADLTRYTTSLAAADYRQVFDALGYTRANVIGGSYGTRLGLEIARQIPERVRTLTLEGVVPPTFAWPTAGARDAEDALNAIVSDCKADRACAQAFPRLAHDIDRAFASLARPATVTIRDPATGAIGEVPFSANDLAYATRGILYGPEALSLPRWFKDAAGGSFERFAQAYVNRARNLDRQIADGVHFGVYCAEDLPRVDWPAARAAAAGTRIGTYLLDQYRAVCDLWPRGTVPAAFFEPVRSQVPTLMMSGRRDPVTPPRNAADMSRTLSSSRSLTWKYGGHGTDGIEDRACRAGIISAFIASADSGNLPSGCMNGSPLPFNVR